MRYWVYVHDMDGDMTQDLGDFESFAHARAAVTKLLDDAAPWLPISRRVIRIVDHLNHSTCWIAAPMEYIKAIAGSLTDA